MHNLHLFFLIAKNINMTNMDKKEAYKKLYNCKIDALDKELNNFLTFKKLDAKNSGDVDFEI